jgi:hypothetical protein
MRALARLDQILAAALRRVGAARLADKYRRTAATSRVAARYLETGRCQYGHHDCAGDWPCLRPEVPG